MAKFVFWFLDLIWWVKRIRSKKYIKFTHNAKNCILWWVYEVNSKSDFFLRYFDVTSVIAINYDMIPEAHVSEASHQIELHDESKHSLSDHASIAI